MSNNLLTLFDLKKASIQKILEDAELYKKNPVSDLILENKNIGLIFEKPSTRTRVSSEVAINKLGGHPVYLSSQELQLNRGESVEDTAEVLDRYLDAIIIRTKNHEHLEKFVKNSSFPVINALSNKAHPLQILADLFTMKENGLDLDKVVVSFLGDGQNNVCRSLMAGLSFFQGNLKIGTHPDYFPEPEYLKKVRDHGGRIDIYEDPINAVQAADVIYTDVWVSMGNEDEVAERKEKLSRYQVNQWLVNHAKKNAIIMHCLPALKGEEITEEAFKSSNSRIMDQAENRLYTMMAVLKFLLQM